MIPLCVAAWVLTLIKLRTILLQGAQEEARIPLNLSDNDGLFIPGRRLTQKKGGIALNVWVMLLFFSITLTFLVEEIATFFNTHTLPNLSLLISHSSVLAIGYFSTVTSLSVIRVPASKQTIRWIRLSLSMGIIALLIIYILFVSKMPPSLFSTPQNLPEVIFKFITCGYGIMLSIIMATTYLTYLPSKKFALMRLRAIMIILCAFSTGTYLLVRIIIFADYFWPFLKSPVLVTLSYVFLICSTLLFFAALLSDKIYVRFVVLSRSIESWRAFQDLKYLVERLLVLCPVVALPTNNPPFWKFLSNPEYYLYRAVVIILDGRTMLADFLPESTTPGEPGFWEEDTLSEAVRVNQALQAVHPSGEFHEIVDAYRRVSQELFKNQNYAL